MVDSHCGQPLRKRGQKIAIYYGGESMYHDRTVNKVVCIRKAGILSSLLLQAKAALAVSSHRSCESRNVSRRLTTI